MHSQPEPSGRPPALRPRTPHGDAGTAVPGSCMTVRSGGWKFFSTKPSESPAPASASGLTDSSGWCPDLGDVVAGALLSPARRVGVLVGSIPLLGDIFDIAWKANRRNYRLLQRQIREPRRHAWRDWAFLLLCAVALAVVFAIPIVLFVWLARWLMHR